MLHTLNLDRNFTVTKRNDWHQFRLDYVIRVDLNDPCKIKIVRSAKWKPLTWPIQNGNNYFFLVGNFLSKICSQYKREKHRPGRWSSCNKTIYSIISKVLVTFLNIQLNIPKIVMDGLIGSTQKHLQRYPTQTNAK